MVESFFWSNYRLTVQSGDYILKWLHQECFLGNLRLGLSRSSCPQPSIFGNSSRKYRWQSPSFGQITDWLFRVAIIYLNDSTKNVFLKIFGLECPEAAVHSHPFSKIYSRNTSSRVILLVKLQTDYSEWRLYTKMTPPRMFSWKSSESFSSA